MNDVRKRKEERCRSMKDRNGELVNAGNDNISIISSILETLEKVNGVA